MGDIAGVHRTVTYGATFKETKDHTRWRATFHHNGQESEASGAIPNDWSALPIMRIRVHIAVQLHIEAALLRGVFSSPEAEPSVGLEKRGGCIAMMKPPRRLLG